jgi:ATP/maltotriose-dependent transcriptional regulator MalT
VATEVDFQFPINVTEREREAWTLWQRGWSPRLIAHHLQVSRTTVRDRLHNVEVKIADAHTADPPA